MKMDKAERIEHALCAFVIIIVGSAFRLSTVCSVFSAGICGASAERLQRREAFDWLPFYLVGSDGQIMVGQEYVLIHQLMPFDEF